MSMSFQQDLNPEAASMIEELYGDRVVALDKRTALLDAFTEATQSQMTELANTAKQPVVVEINKPDEIKTMQDGTEYKVTPQGWKKVSPNGA